MRDRRRSERGTALLLFPAGVLVVIILSAVAVDLAAVHAAQRSLQRAVDAAADDAVAQLDVEALLRTGDVVVDLHAARRSVALDLEGADLVGPERPRVTVEPGPRPNSIRVRARVGVPRIIAGAVPGVGDRVEVSASVVAELSEGA